MFGNVRLLATYKAPAKFRTSETSDRFTTINDKELLKNVGKLNFFFRLWYNLSLSMRVAQDEDRRKIPKDTKI